MLEDDIQIYNTAKHSSAPILPLREVLDFIAIECVYEPKKEKKKNLERLRKQIRSKVAKKRRAIYKEKEIEKDGSTLSLWSILGNDKTEESDSESNVDSNTSSLTMNTLNGDKSVNEGNIEDIIERHSFAKLDSFGMPTLTFSGDEDYSDDEMDDMTISTVALIGSDVRDPEVRPEYIFTHANDEESNKWWYEGNNNISDVQPNTQDETTYGEFDISRIILKDNHEDDISQNSCLSGLSIIVDTANAMLCPGMKKYDLTDDYDLKLEVDHNDGFTGGKTFF